MIANVLALVCSSFAFAGFAVRGMRTDASIQRDLFARAGGSEKRIARSIGSFGGSPPVVNVSERTTEVQTEIMKEQPKHGHAIKGRKHRRKTASRDDAPVHKASCREATATSLSLSCTADAGLYDLVSFELFVSDTESLGVMRPSLISYTARVASDGRVSGEVAGLFPNTNYTVTIRAHLKGESEGNPSSWIITSNESSECSTSEASGSRENMPIKKTNSRWLEVFRYNEVTEFPDYLENHNAADGIGMETSILPLFYNPPSDYGKGLTGKVTKKLTKRGGKWRLLCKFAKCKHGRSIVTRYCVEMDNVSLQNPLFSQLGSTESAFAPYRPCNGGECPCDGKANYFAYSRPTPDAAKTMCDGVKCQMCNPDTQKRVGAEPIFLPFANLGKALVSGIRLTRTPPKPINKADPWGTWYSFPGEGFCSFGQTLGDGGCTWRLDPLSHSASVEAFIENGLDISGSIVNGVSVKVGYRNANKVRQFFKGLSPCGEASKA